MLLSYRMQQSRVKGCGERGKARSISQQGKAVGYMSVYAHKCRKNAGRAQMAAQGKASYSEECAAPGNPGAGCRDLRTPAARKLPRGCSWGKEKGREREEHGFEPSTRRPYGCMPKLKPPCGAAAPNPPCGAPNA
jgi:hypothetical protein